MINLDFSIAVTILYVIVLYVFMNNVFFKPIMRTIQERRRLTEGRMQEARERIEQTDRKAAEYEQTLRAARADAFRQQEQIRERVLAEKAELVAQAKSEADAVIHEGRARLNAQAEASRKKLEQEVDILAKQLTTTILRD